MPAFSRFHRRIEEKRANRAAAPVLIVALGDSVTQGVGAHQHLYHEEVYHALLRRRLQERHPLTTFSVINAGVDGQQASDAFARLDRDVISHHPDLVIIGFALNDAVIGGREGVAAYRANLERLIREIRAQSEADLLLLTPNMMVTRPNDAVHEVHHHCTERFIAVQLGGVLAAYAQQIREVGVALEVPVADVYARWEIEAALGTDTTAWLSNGLNHPYAEGHAVIVDTIWPLIYPQA